MSRRGAPPQVIYTFKHALVQDAAYESVPHGRRPRIHAQVVDALVALEPDIEENRPEVLAHHFTEAGQGVPAVAFWLRAGQRAAGRSALVEAVSYLTRGVEALALLCDGGNRDRAELDLQMALGTYLIPLRGWTAPEAARAWTRARELCERLGDEERLPRVMWGQCIIQACRTDLDASRLTAEELVRLGNARRNQCATIFGHRSLALALTHAAQFQEARYHLEHAIELGSGLGAAVFKDHFFDPVVTARAYLARCLLHAGYPDQHERMLGRALADAADSGHAPTLAYVLFQGAELGFESRDPRAARDKFELLIPLARDHGFTLWQAMAEAVEGWSMAEEDEHTRSIDKVRLGLAVYQDRNELLMQPFLNAMLSSVLSRAGRIEEALQAIDAGIRLVAEKGETIWEPELHRLRGDVMLALSRHSEAEASYCRSLDVARRQGAKLAELRVATSLAHLLTGQGERQRGVELLRPVYRLFSEGFSATDLREARELLEELASANPRAVNAN